MLRQLLIQECVVCAPEFNRVEIVTQLTKQEQLGFCGEGMTQRNVVVRKVLFVRIGIPELIEFEPWEEESRHECLSSIIREHSADLPLENGTVVQPVGLRVLKQRGIGAAIPQECGETRSNLLAADGCSRFRVNVCTE